jgi:arsenate reductase
MTTVIYHNPRCSKSRQTLALLEENNVQPEVVEYLKSPLDANTIEQILSKLGVSVRDIIRTKESEYKENGLDDESLTDVQIIETLVKVPKLIERPIVVNGDKAAIGRPPENVLAII